MVEAAVAVVEVAAAAVEVAVEAAVEVAAAGFFVMSFLAASFFVVSFLAASFFVVEAVVEAAAVAAETTVLVAMVVLGLDVLLVAEVWGNEVSTLVAAEVIFLGLVVAIVKGTLG